MSFCRSCGAEILWGITRDGKRMPFDAKPVPGLFAFGVDEKVYVPIEARYRSHFSTCPQADSWRKEAAT